MDKPDKQTEDLYHVALIRLFKSLRRIQERERWLHQDLEDLRDRVEELEGLKPKPKPFPFSF